MSAKSPRTLERTNRDKIERATRAAVEELEARMLLAFTALVNFQPSGTPVPAGYVADTGAVFGARNGLTYGWDADNSAQTRDRNSSASLDQRYDTLIHTQVSGSRTWEMAVPNGDYVVRLVSGDAGYINSTYMFNVEGVLAMNATPFNARKWIESSARVTVSDGKLTVSNATGSVNNKINFIEIYSQADIGRPSVSGTSPASGETGVSRDNFVGVDLLLPGGSLNPATVNTTNVKMFRASDNVEIPSNVNTSGGGDSIVLQPQSLMDPNTSYYFQISAGVADVGGNPIVPYSMTFTTGTAGGPVVSDIQFTKTALPTTNGNLYTAVVIGPDHKLYAGTLEGLIIRFSINADGTLGSGQTISTIQTANGGPRILSGFAFDPASTASNLILYVVHNDRSFDTPAEWSGKLTKLTGSNLQTATDVLIGLPRADHNHVTNQPVFGPDGAIYFTQGGNTAQGAMDSTWGLRPERLLSAAVLRLDLAKLPASLPLNVQTEGIANPYNPWNTNNAVTIYATGVRNSWDLAWTSDGFLYAANNGSNAGGATPGTPSLPIPGSIRIDGDDDGNAANGQYSSPAVPGIDPLNVGQNDYLYNIAAGGYYGHPNPSRYEYVLDGGNPTSGTDPAEVKPYPVGTQPDRNWRGIAFDFGSKRSPDGMIEYRSNAFGGALKGKLLVVRFSGGDDIIVLSRDAAGKITSSQTGLVGMTGFNDPLDLIEDPTNGNIYVAEHTGAKITLLTPVGGVTATPATPANVVASVVSPNQTKVKWDAVTGATLYRIQRKAPGETVFSNYATTSGTSYDDMIVGSSSTYAYQVRAENSAGSSAYSAVTTVTTPAPGSWSEGVPLPFAMAECGGVIINDKMYIVGEDNTSTWVFDFATQTWTAKAVRPFTGDPTNAEHSTETVGGKMYLLGGLTGGSENKVQIYNPATNTWTLGAQRSYNAGSAPSAVINNQIYVAGGAVTTPTYGPVAKLSKYNPANNTWTALKDEPFPRHSAAGGTDGTKLYIFGGRDQGLEASDGTDTVQIYDPATNTWATSEDPGSTIPRMPRPTRGPSIKAIYYGGEFYIFGGENSSGNYGATADHVFNRVDIYNPVTKTWRVGNPMITARHATEAVLYQDHVYIVGGGIVHGTSSSNMVEVFDILAGNSPAPTIPADPTLLGATTVSQTQINLSWTDNASNETGYRIERKDGPSGVFQEIATVGANVTTYQSTGLTAGSQYFYQVRAYNGIGNSGYSNVASATTNPATATGPSFQQDSGADGILSIQAEHFDANVAASGHNWVLVTPSGASGGQAMQAMPNDGTNIDTPNFVGSSPHMDYNVTFVKTGIHYVWIRGIGLTNSDDSLHVGLDGQAVATSDRISSLPSSINWTKNTIDGVVAQINITSLGAHVLNVYMREDGAIVDKIVLTTNATFTPTSTGPAESPRVGPTAPAAPSGLVATVNGTKVDLTWVDNSSDETGFRIERKIGAAGTYSPLTTVGPNVTSFSDTTVVAGTDYVYRVFANNGVDSTPSNEAASTTPAAPNAPSGLVATASQTKVDLTWTDNSTDETNFKIERKTGAAGTWGPLTTVAPDATSYSDTSIAAGTTYFYRVIATNGFDSLPSNEAQATTPSAPTAPSGLSATAVLQTRVDLAWTDNSSDETAFRIERKTGAGGTWAPLVSDLAPGTQAYSDLTAVASTTYFYRVIATNGLDSTPSNEAQATTPAPVSAFTSADIGSPTAGSTSTVTEGSDYNVTAGGVNVWNTSDSFRFVYKSVTGDFDVITRINSLTAADPQSMAGLMARETLNANSRNAYMKVWPGTAGYRFTYRSSTGGTSVATGAGAAAYPNVWVRLTRVGSVFTGFSSADGLNWTQVGTISINLPATIFVGMAASAKSSTGLTTAQFRSFGNGPTTPPGAPVVVGARPVFSSTLVVTSEKDLVASSDPLVM